MNETYGKYHPGRTAARNPDKPAIILDDGTVAYSFRTFEETSNRFAHLLRARGIQRGGRVAFLLENRKEYLPLVWGAWRIGTHVTTIATHLSAEEIDYILQDCGAELLVTSTKFAATLAKVSPAPAERLDGLMLDGAETGFEDISGLLESQPGDPVPDQYEGVDMLYSSGTTGRPKGIFKPLPDRPFGTIAASNQALYDLYGLDDSICYLSPAPLYHAAPLQWTLRALRAGGTVVVMRKFDAERALQLIEQCGVTHSQWVPTHFVRLCRLPEAVKSAHDLSSHRCAIHAAAPCPDDLKKAMIAWWGPILREYYAGSEGLGHTAIDTTEWRTYPGSVGRPVGCRVHICDADGEPLPQGETGIVYFESSSQFEYLNAPEKTAEVRNARGWTTLGDIGHLNDEGFLFLTDRLANTIISGGVNIYPQEIENTLSSHPSIEDVAVIGVPNEEFGEEVKAVVQLATPSDAGEAMAQALNEFCRAHLSSVKCPRSFDFVAALPRQENGKLYKKQLVDHYRALSRETTEA
ncbi:MAG: AMP-binding protein [Pseudodonghicola sp.]|nr:AMP-binding protein [Pseudodonghicola sp.]